MNIKWGEKRRGVDELIGFDEKKVDELSDKHPSIRTTIKREFGKVSRYKREIIRQSKKSSVSYRTFRKVFGFNGERGKSLSEYGETLKPKNHS